MEGGRHRFFLLNLLQEPSILWTVQIRLTNTPTAHSPFFSERGVHGSAFVTQNTKDINKRNDRKTS